MVPDIVVMQNQTAAPTLHAILTGFEDRILAILIMSLDPIARAAAPSTGGATDSGNPLG